MNTGLDSVYYAKITEDASGNETYGTPKKLADAIMADINITRKKVKIFADDLLKKVIEEFSEGTMRLNLLQFMPEAQKDLFSVKLDANGAIVSCAEDEPDPVALGFRSLIGDGKYEYLWLYRVQFTAPNGTYNTKGESITVNTPTTEGSIMHRHKPDYDGDHPWKVNLIEDGTQTVAAAIAAWFDSVYEAANPSAVQVEEPAAGEGTTPATSG